MGTYKVPQNVEAEDKILGPLTLKQFIYAIIGIGYGFLMFAILRSVILLWLLIGVPPMLFLLALGLYQKDDQPLETYVIAVAQFIARPKFRKWRKEPIAEVFRVEPPPPKAEPVQRDPSEVRSQLQQLAELVDTRGWSAKEPELQEPQQEVPVVDLKDRIGADVLQQSAPIPVAAVASAGGEPPTTVLPAAPSVTQDDDILSTQTQAAQDLNVLIENTVKSVREEALQKMRTQPATPKPAKTALASAPISAPPKTSAANANSSVSIGGMTGSTSGDILKLATEGGDLTVTQIAAQAHKQQATLAEGQTVQLRNANTTAA
jgi:hypothetical protein